MKALFIEISSIICLFASSIACFSQGISVDYGPEVASGRMSNIVHVSKVGDNILVARSDRNYGGSISLQVFKADDLTFVTSAGIFGKNGPNSLSKKTFSSNSFLSVGNKLLFFVESYLKEEQSHNLYVQAIDKDGLFIDKPVLIDKIEARKKGNSGSFMVAQSPDSSKILVVENPPDPNDKNVLEAFGFKIFDINLTRISNLEVTLPLSDRSVGVEDYYIDNNGFVYILVNVTNPRKDTPLGQSLVYHMLYQVNPLTGEVSEMKIQMDGKHIGSIAMRLNPTTGKVFCAGLYADLNLGQHRGGDIDGVFFLRANPSTMKAEVTMLNPIDKKMVSLLEYGRDNKNIDDGEGISDFFLIKDLSTNVDGGATLLCESRYFNAYTRCSPNNACVTTYTFYRENIFAVGITAEGGIKFLVDIPKCQISTNDDGFFSSYGLLENNAKLFVMFNDNPANLSPQVRTIRDVKTMSNVARAQLLGAELRPDGGYTKFVVHDNKSKNLSFCPQFTFGIGYGSYVVPFVSTPCGLLPSFKRVKTGIAKVSVP